MSKNINFLKEGSANNLGEMNRVSKESEQQNSSRDFGFAEGVNNPEIDIDFYMDDIDVNNSSIMTKEAETAMYRDIINAINKYRWFIPEENNGLVIMPDTDNNTIHIDFGLYKDRIGEHELIHYFEYPDPIIEDEIGFHFNYQMFGEVIVDGKVYDLDKMLFPFFNMAITRLSAYTMPFHPMSWAWGGLKNPKVHLVIFKEFN